MGAKIVRESDLYPPVRDWLAKRGYTIHVEMFGVDIVAMKEDQIVAIELKLCLTESLYRQCEHNSEWADLVIGVIASDSKKTAMFRYKGFGLLQVMDGKVRQRIKPRPQPWARIKRRDYRIKKLMNRAPAMEHETAGLPSCRRLREQRLLRSGN